MTKTYVEYNANNSGGRDWLTKEHWLKLEAAGWKVIWVGIEIVDDTFDPDGLPATVPAQVSGDEHWHKPSQAFKAGNWDTVQEAAAEWEKVTGMPATDAGCPCCGQPHTFTLYRDGKHVESGPHTSYTASW